MSRRRAAAVEEDDDELVIEEEEEPVARSGKGRGRAADAYVEEGDEDDEGSEGGDEEDDAPDKGKKRGKKNSSAAAAKAGGGAKKQPRKRRGVGDDDDDDKAEGGGGGGKAQVFDRLPGAEQRALVSGVVRLLLLKHRDKLRVTSADVSKLVLCDQYAKMRLSSDLLRRAGAELESIFGLELVQQDKVFFLRSAVRVPDPIALLGLPEPTPLDGLAAVLVGVLHTSKTGRLEEQELWDALTALDFHEDVEHPVFGKWRETILKRLVTEQRYLVRIKTKDQHNDVVHVFGPGPRIAVEWPLAPTEAFVSCIYGREVDPAKIKEMETERGLVQVPGVAAAAPARRAPSRKPAAAKKKKSKSKFADGDEEDDDLFDDDDDE